MAQTQTQRNQISSSTQRRKVAVQSAPGGSQSGGREARAENESNEAQTAQQ